MIRKIQKMYKKFEFVLYFLFVIAVLSLFVYVNVFHHSDYDKNMRIHTIESR